MKRYNVNCWFLILLLFTSFFVSYGQENGESESKAVKTYKNTLSTNLTNPGLISSRYITFGYERILKNNQSFSLSLGTFSLPKFLSPLSDSLNLKTNYKDKGFHLAADYRFYLMKENKYAAPRGVYIGPYYSFNFLNRTNNWDMQTENYQGDVASELDVTIHTVGVELGYQFVFWDRLAVDLVLLGPGVGFYGLKTKLNTSLSPEDESMFFDKLNEILEDRIPGYDRVIGAGEFSRKGSVQTTDFGYRYLINIGYRF